MVASTVRLVVGDRAKGGCLSEQTVMGLVYVLGDDRSAYTVYRLTKHSDTPSQTDIQKRIDSYLRKYRKTLV